MSEATNHLSEHHGAPRLTARVVSNERITRQASPEEVRDLVLEIDAPEFPVEVGQSVGVIAPASGTFGESEHFRLYSVADLPERGPSGRPRIAICVRRCSYIDEYSGEQYQGVASNYLCDRRPGDAIQITGPFGLAFEVPQELDANLILIGSGTGIAPFRAFVKHLHRNVPGWRGRIWLFYGARSGLEMLYMNDERDDFAQYYDDETFQAFQALSPRPRWDDPIAWDSAIEARGAELWEKLGEPKTYVYVAGLEPMLAELDRVFAKIAGSEERWRRRKAELQAGKRWVELVY
jgi:ferredoxin--NADP+ reductase